MPDENGETRRQKNIRFGEPSKNPEIDYPDEAAHVWDWFWDELNPRRRSGPEALTFADLGAWAELTGRTVRPEEIRMLLEMDNAFLREARDEQAAAQARAAEQAKVKT